jgi:hypothetical protein
MDFLLSQMLRGVRPLASGFFSLNYKAQSLIYSELIGCSSLNKAMHFSFNSFPKPLKHHIPITSPTKVIPRPLQSIAHYGRAGGVQAGFSGGWRCWKMRFIKQLVGQGFDESVSIPYNFVLVTAPFAVSVKEDRLIFR